MKRFLRTRLLLFTVVAAGSASAQTMLDQEQRLIQIHSLLLDLPPVDEPGACRAGQLSAGLELVFVPPIDGTTGNKKQITASDRTPVFPRPRIALGLPAPESFRAFVGISYVPPVLVRNVSLNYFAGEAGIAWLPGTLRVGLGAHLLHAASQSPVTDPVIRDTLNTTELGAELSAGARFGWGALALTPYGGLGLVHLSGDFRVTSDGVTLSSQNTVPALHAGARLTFRDRWEAIAEAAYYPGRLIHPSVRLGYLFDLLPRTQ